MTPGSSGPPASASVSVYPSIKNARARDGFASICSFSDPDTFDCVIGRYVLVHQSDPVDFLRTAARLVRPGGIIAFHEVDFAGGFNSLPRVWRWDAAGNLSLATFREVLPHFDSAKRLIEHFFDAGLPVPNLFRKILVGGGERSPLYAWFAETMRSVWPQLVEMGIVTGRGDSGRDT